MALWLRAHIAFVENPGSVPSTHRGSLQPSMIPVQENLMSFLTSCGTLHATHVGKQSNTKIKANTTFKVCCWNSKMFQQMLIIECNKPEQNER